MILQMLQCQLSAQLQWFSVSNSFRCLINCGYLILTVLLIALSVVVVCVVIRYHKKQSHLPATVSSFISNPNNAAATAAAAKEKELNDNSFNSPTYSELMMKANNYTVLSENDHNTLPVPQDYGIPNNYEIPPNDAL